jgi:hypothetical protein
MKLMRNFVVGGYKLSNKGRIRAEQTVFIQKEPYNQPINHSELGGRVYGDADVNQLFQKNAIHETYTLKWVRR